MTAATKTKPIEADEIAADPGPASTFTVTDKYWRDATDDVLLFAAKDDGLPSVCTVHLVRTSERSFLEATDRFTLARLTIRVEDYSGPDLDVTLTKESVNAIRRMFPPARNLAQPITFAIDREHVTVSRSTGDAEITAKFPLWTLEVKPGHTFINADSLLNAEIGEPAAMIGVSGDKFARFSRVRAANDHADASPGRDAMTAVDRWPHDYPRYDHGGISPSVASIVRRFRDATRPMFIPVLSVDTDGRILVNVIPGPMPEGWLQERRYGCHSRRNTKAARKSDPRRFYQVYDAIRNQACEREMLVRGGVQVRRRAR